MAIIVKRDPNDSDLTLWLNNEQIARTINIGQNWSWIRLGIRMQMSASLSITNPNFAMGFCSGTSSLYGDNNTTHFVGQDFDTNAIWTADGPTRGKNYAQLAARIVVKTPNALASYNSGSQKNWAIGCTPTSASSRRTYSMIDFVKGSGDPSLWTLVYTWNKAADLSTFTTDESFASFYSNMTALTASLNTSADYTRSYFLVPVSESINGILDTVTIFWNQAFNTLEICDIAVYRFA